MTFNYKFKRFYEIFFTCVIISIRCIYLCFYPLNVYLVLPFMDDGCWRKSLGADGIHGDDVAIIRRGRLQWMATPLRRRLSLSPDAPRRVLTRRFRMCDVIRLSKMMSPRLIRHRLRDLWWWRALAQADWDGLDGAGSSSSCQLCSDGVFWNTQSSNLGVCARAEHYLQS